MAGGAMEKNQAGILGQSSIVILLWLFLEKLAKEISEQRSEEVRAPTWIPA